MDKEITLCKESKELLKYVEEKYKEVEEYTQTKEVLIHMYHERDTKSDGDEWWGGYMDALFITVKVYDPSEEYQKAYKKTQSKIKKNTQETETGAKVSQQKEIEK